MTFSINSVKKRRARLLPLLLIGLLVGCTKPDYETLDHGSGSFADLRGRHVLINYWAAWCKPCITELPELNAFAQEFADEAVVLAVNYDGVDRATLERQARELDIQFPVLLSDPAAQLGYERPQALPSTFVLGPDGRLKQVLLGPQTIASLRAALDPMASAAEGAK